MQRRGEHAVAIECPRYVGRVMLLVWRVRAASAAAPARVLGDGSRGIAEMPESVYGCAQSLVRDLGIFLPFPRIRSAVESSMR